MLTFHSMVPYKHLRINYAVVINPITIPVRRCFFQKTKTKEIPYHSRRLQIMLDLHSTLNKNIEHTFLSCSAGKFRSVRISFNALSALFITLGLMNHFFRSNHNPHNAWMKIQTCTKIVL